MIADVITDELAEIPLGSYELVFQHWWGEEDLDTAEPTQWAVLSFIRCENPRVATLRADSELEIPEAYSMVARPAF